MVMVSFHLNRIVTKTVGKELQAAAHTESAVKMQDLWRLSLGAPANSSPKCCSLGESPWNAESLHEMPSGCTCTRQFRRSWGIRCSYGLLGLFLRGGAWSRWLGCDIAFRKGTVVLVGAWLVLGVNCYEIVMTCYETVSLASQVLWFPVSLCYSSCWVCYWDIMI